MACRLNYKNTLILTSTYFFGYYYQLFLLFSEFLKFLVCLIFVP